MTNFTAAVHLDTLPVQSRADAAFSSTADLGILETPGDDSMLEPTSVVGILPQNMTWAWLHEDLFLQYDPLVNVHHADLFPMDVDSGQGQPTHISQMFTTRGSTPVLQRHQSTRSGIPCDNDNSLPDGVEPLVGPQLQVDVGFSDGGTPSSCLLEPTTSRALNELRPTPDMSCSTATSCQTYSHGPDDTANNDAGRSNPHRAQYQEHVVQKLVDFACNVFTVPPDPLARAKFRHEICCEVEEAFGLSHLRPYAAKDDLLDHLVELYLEHFYPLWPLFRKQDLGSDRVPLLLYITLTSIGSIYAGDTAAAYGFMTHEKIRQKIIVAPLQSHLPDEVCVPLCQSLLLIQASALYFGRRQSFSIAQQLGSIIVSHARKMNLFNNGLYSYHHSEASARITTSQEDIVSHWIKAEIRKRLAFGILRAEVFISLLLNSRALVSYEEFNIELPCSSVIWEYNSMDLQKHVMTLHSSQGNRREYLYSDLVRIATDRNEALPDLLHRDFELLLFGIQQAVWQISHDREMMPRLNKKFQSDFLTNPQNDLFGTWSYSVQHCDRPNTQQHWMPQSDNGQLNSTDLLDCYFRDMSDMHIDYLRCLSALRKWKRSFAATCMRTDITKVRDSLLASRLLYHLSFIRITADIEKFHLLNHQLVKGPVDLNSLRLIWDWSSSQDAKVALEHACAIWSLISREIKRDEHVRAKFNILTHISLYHAASVVWVFAGTHKSATEAALDMIETSGNFSGDELLIHSVNIPRITLDFAALLRTVTPAWMQSSSFSTTTSMMATRPFPELPSLLGR